jgi:hypothetical protein
MRMINAWALATFFAVGCGPSSDCIDGCPSHGIDPESSLCREVCSEDCADIEANHGFPATQCEELQAR